MARVLLVRHGEAAAAWGDAPADPGLSQVGLAQARRTAEALRSLNPERALTSPMRRCRETAQAFAAVSGLSAQLAHGVTEIATPAALDGGERAAWLQRAFAATWAEIEGGDYAAWRDAVAACVAQAGGAVVFTHFVAINAAVSAALRSDKVVVLRPAPAAIVTLETDGTRLTLVDAGAQAQGAVL